MRILLTALALGAISMLIVCISGLSSGLVRLSTLALRALFAFAMTSAASYFLMMLFDLYDEYTRKKLEAAMEPPPVEEAAPAEVSPEEGTPEVPSPSVEQAPPVGFQPLNANNLPNVGR